MAGARAISGGALRRRSHGNVAPRRLDNSLVTAKPHHRHRRRRLATARHRSRSRAHPLSHEPPQQASGPQRTRSTPPAAQLAATRVASAAAPGISTLAPSASRPPRRTARPPRCPSARPASRRRSAGIGNPARARPWVIRSQVVASPDSNSAWREKSGHWCHYCRTVGAPHSAALGGQRAPLQPTSNLVPPTRCSPDPQRRCPGYPALPDGRSGEPRAGAGARRRSRSGRGLRARRRLPRTSGSHGVPP